MTTSGSSTKKTAIAATATATAAATAAATNAAASTTVVRSDDLGGVTDALTAADSEEAEMEALIASVTSTPMKTGEH